MDAAATPVALGALALGLGFGALIERTGFCTMGAVADVVAFKDWRRARSWMAAVAVALVGIEGLRRYAHLDLTQTNYLAPQLSWAAALIGGLMMGFGMTLCGGCVSRNLVRFGSGDLRSGVVLLMVGLFAYMTQHGLTALARVALERATDVRLDALGLTSQGVPELAAAAFGAAPQALRGAASVLCGVSLAAVCLASGAFRASWRHTLAGVGVGAAVVAGWWISSVLGYDEFEPARPVSLSFTAPVGNAMVYLMTFTGSRLDFGISLVAGTVLGAAVAAATAGAWRLHGFADLADLMRNLGGAALMGAGGVLALGCSIGQGITGLSTLALGSVLATAAIVAGAVAGLRFLEGRT